MFKNSYVLSVLVDGHVAKEEAGTVKIPIESEYGVRLKNKYAEPVAVDLYIDGQLANEAGHIFLAGNSSLDVTNWILKDKTARKFVLAKTSDSRVAEPNDCENGIIEARFYKPLESVNEVITTHIIKEVWPYYPVWPVIIKEVEIWPRPWPQPYDPWAPWKPVIYCGGSSGQITFNDGGEWSGGDGCLHVDGSGKFKVGGAGDNLEPPKTYTNTDGTFADKSDCFSVNCNNNCKQSIEDVATIKGRETVNSVPEKKIDFGLEKEPTVLKIKVVGTKKSRPKILYCKSCGRRARDKENYCSKCGEKL